MLKLVTFNAGLAVGVLPYATERVPHVGRALAELDADLLFLQEVWLESQWDAVVARTRARFPHVFRPPAAARITHGACSPEEVAPLVACARSNCDGLTGDDANDVLRSLRSARYARQVSSKLLVVEEAFVARGKGVLVMPRFTAENPRRGAFPVELRMPDGTTRQVQAEMEVAHMRGALAPYAMYRLHVASPDEVPTSTEIWAL